MYTCKLNRLYMSVRGKNTDVIVRQHRHNVQVYVAYIQALKARLVYQGTLKFSITEYWNTHQHRYYK